MNLAWARVWNNGDDWAWLGSGLTRGNNYDRSARGQKGVGSGDAAVGGSVRGKRGVFE